MAGLVAAFALALAVVGLTDALARAVVERRRELAIGAALGAGPAWTVASVLTAGAVPLATGIGVGLGAATLSVRGLSGMLYALGPHDLATYGMASVVVAVTGLLGCYLPARRAALISPAELLRSE